MNALSALASMVTAARDWNYMATELDWGKLRLPVEELQNTQRYFTPVFRNNASFARKSHEIRYFP